VGELIWGNDERICSFLGSNGTATVWGDIMRFCARKKSGKEEHVSGRTITRRLRGLSTESSTNFFT